MIARLLVALIRLYQMTLSKLIFAIFGPVCRFEPSCSRYALACIGGHGALRGSLLSLKRLCRCHPFHPGGFDPPPPPPPPSCRLGSHQETRQPSPPGAASSVCSRARSGALERFTSTTHAHPGWVARQERAKVCSVV